MFNAEGCEEAQIQRSCDKPAPRSAFWLQLLLSPKPVPEFPEWNGCFNRLLGKLGLGSWESSQSRWDKLFASLFFFNSNNFFLSAFLSLGSSDRKHSCFSTNFRRARGRNHSVLHCHCRFCSPRFPRSENLILSSFNTRITITWSMKSKYHS